MHSRAYIFIEQIFQMKNLYFCFTDLSKEDTFVPYTEEMRLPEEPSYHFISECFFLTHQVLHIGYSIVHKIIKLNGSIHRLQKIYENVKETGSMRIMVLVKEQLKKGKQWN